MKKLFYFIILISFCSCATQKTQITTKRKAVQQLEKKNKRLYGTKTVWGDNAVYFFKKSNKK